MLLKFIHRLCSDFTTPLGVLLSIVLIMLFKRLKKSDKVIPLIVICYTLTELIGSYLGFLREYNAWFFNIMILPTYYLFAYLYYQNINSKKLKVLIKVLTILFTIWYFINNLYGQANTGFNTLTYIPVNTFVAFLAFMYMKEFVESIDENPFNDLLFWFSLATVIDLTASIPVICTLSTYEFARSEIADRFLVVLLWLEYFWYILILTGSIWTKVKVKLPSSLS